MDFLGESLNLGSLRASLHAKLEKKNPNQFIIVQVYSRTKALGSQVGGFTHATHCISERHAPTKKQNPSDNSKEALISE